MSNTDLHKTSKRSHVRRAESQFYTLQINIYKLYPTSFNRLQKDIGCNTIDVTKHR